VDREDRVAALDEKTHIVSIAPKDFPAGAKEAYTMKNRLSSTKT